MSLSPGVIQQSRQAMEQKKNAFNQGPLSATLKALPSATSKLILLNMGNAIKAALPSVPRELKEMMDPIAGDLAEATANTVVQISTEEAPNSLGIQVGLNQLPKISDLLPPIMQFVGSMH